MPREKDGHGRTGNKHKAAAEKRDAAAAAQAAEQLIRPAPPASPRPKRRKRRAWRSSRRRPLTPLPRPHLRYPRQAARRPPAGARSCSTTRRCRCECARRSAEPPSLVRPAFLVGPPRVGTSGAVGWTLRWQGGQCGMRRSWGTKRASMMQGDREVQAGPSGIATPACGARGGRPLFAAFARLCTPR